MSRSFACSGGNMPQPVTGLKHLVIRPAELAQRPELAARIAAIAAQWTMIESDLAELFVALLGADENAALSIYLEFFDRGVRRIVFDTLARSRMERDTLKAFRTLFDKINAKSKARNTIVHGFWAVSDDHADGLILLDANDYHREDFAFKHAKLSTRSEEVVWSEASWSRIGMMKYTHSDFSEIFLEISKLEDEIADFRSKMRLLPKTNPP